MAFGKRSNGYNLGWNESVIFNDYDVCLDRRPEELLEEFRDHIDYEPEDAELQTLLEDTQDFVIDTIEHRDAMARDLNLSGRAIDGMRVDAQSEAGTVMMSNVWGGEWYGRRIGTCLERGMTAHAMYRMLGLESRLHIGRLETEEGMPQHTWTTVEDYISDPSIGGDGTVPVDQADRYHDSFFYTK